MSRYARFQESVSGGAGKRKAQRPKTSGRARFWEVWVVVLARGRSNPQKRAVVLVFGVGGGVVVVREGSTSPQMLVFGGCSCQWEVIPPENEHNGSFSGGCEW